MKFYTLEEANANVDLLEKIFNYVRTLYDLIGQRKNDVYLVLSENKRNYNNYSNKNDKVNINQLEIKSTIIKYKNREPCLTYI